MLHHIQQRSLRLPSQQHINRQCHQISRVNPRHAAQRKRTQRRGRAPQQQRGKYKAAQHKKQIHPGERKAQPALRPRAQPAQRHTPVRPQHQQRSHRPPSLHHPQRRGAKRHLLDGQYGHQRSSPRAKSRNKSGCATSHTSPSRSNTPSVSSRCSTRVTVSRVVFKRQAISAWVGRRSASPGFA